MTSRSAALERVRKLLALATSPNPHEAAVAAARAQALTARLTGATLENHVAAHRRLTHPQEMGTLFKTFALRPQGAPQLPGFAE